MRWYRTVLVARGSSGSSASSGDSVSECECAVSSCHVLSVCSTQRQVGELDVVHCRSLVPPTRHRLRGSSGQLGVRWWYRTND